MPSGSANWLDRLAGRLAPQRLRWPLAAFSVFVLALAATALGSGNNLLFLLFAMALSLLLVSGLGGRLNLAGLRLECHLPEPITARQQIPVRLRLSNEKRWLPSFSVWVLATTEGLRFEPGYFPLIRARETAEQSLTVVFPRRGCYEHHVFLVSSSFPFGFVERGVRLQVKSQVIVYPCLEGLPEDWELFRKVLQELETQRRGQELDFYRIRPYQPPEDARRVDWKATAHTGEIQVREFTRVQDPLVELLLDLAATSRDWFERAVECCAFLAWRLSQQEIRLRFWTQELDVRVPGEANVYSLLRYLAQVQPQPAGVSWPSETAGSYRLLFTSRPQAWSLPVHRIVSDLPVSGHAGHSAFDRS